ncbi:hypothetical protein D9M70_497660 [compost metagenome]
MGFEHFVDRTAGTLATTQLAIGEGHCQGKQPGQLMRVNLAWIAVPDLHDRDAWVLEVEAVDQL